MPQGQAGYRIYYREYRYDAKRRGLKFQLTTEEFIQIVTGNCHYCGDIPRQRKRVQTRSTRGSWMPPMNGVDRIDNLKGYYVENCVTCCSVCNRMKGKLFLSELLDKVAEIYNKWIRSD